MSERITANLPSRNFSATQAFYARLGFETAFKGPDWMILERGPLEVEFFPYPDLDPTQSSFSACLRLPSLDALWAEWSCLGLPETGIPRLQGPAWTLSPDLRMFALIDPDGSLLRCLGR